MELDAEVDEIDIPGVRLGQRAVISVDALPDLQLEGKVTSISPLSTEKSGVILYKVKVGFDVLENSGLKSGMSATADIIFTKRSNVLLVPSRAIGQDSSGNPMVKVMVDEQIQERPVVIGISDGYQTEIVDGLDEGEVVVIER
jgi:multidrug efflux pump subunit AcrA (membrane-fusion protein)